MANWTREISCTNSGWFGFGIRGRYIKDDYIGIVISFGQWTWWFNWEKRDG